MPKPFKLIEEKFSKVDQEWQWTYELKIKFNYQSVTLITITSYYQTKPGRKMINNKLILEILEKRFHNKKSEPTEYQGKRKAFKREAKHQSKSYRLIFWFKDHTTNHLWIRNCYPID